MKVSWKTRYREWKALLDWMTEHQFELVAKGRMAAFVSCLQRHWQDMLKRGGDRWVANVMRRIQELRYR